MTTTIRDVAKRANVSISTVSRVLNNPEIVTENKRKKVEKVINELNYRPNSLARGLIFKKTNTVGVLIPDISNQFSASLIKGIEEKGNQLNYNVILCDTGHSKKRILNYLQVLIEKQVDGIIFSSEFLKKEYYDLLKKNNIPLVLAATESFDYNVPSVKIDDIKAAYTATKFLIDSNHKKLAMISGPKDDLIAGLPRVEGFKKAHKKLLGYNPSNNQISYSDFSYEGAYASMKTLFKKMNGDIDAVFCASDKMATGAISFLSSANLKVPEDISIMGFDDSIIAQIFIPKLTTLRQPIYDIGFLSMVKLNDVINNGIKRENIRTYLPHELTVRESVNVNN